MHQHRPHTRLRDLAWRGAGLGALGVAALSTAAHRVFLQAHAAAPASVFETLLALLTLFAASLGILLLLHGGRLFRPDAPVPDESPLPPHDGRDQLASLLAARAIERARRRS